MVEGAGLHKHLPPQVTMGRPARYELGLAPREAQVLEYLTLGLSRDEIARRQGVGLETVKSQLRWIYRKLGVRGRAEACVRCWTEAGVLR